MGDLSTDFDAAGAELLDGRDVAAVLKLTLAELVALKNLPTLQTAARRCLVMAHELVEWSRQTSGSTTAGPLLLRLVQEAAERRQAARRRRGVLPVSPAVAKRAASLLP